MARLQIPFFRAGLLFVWRPIWLFFNYWPFYLNCGTTFNCSFYGTCHIPGLIAKFSILKSPIINDIIQPNMLNWILLLWTLISNTPENVKIFEITCFQSHTLSFLVLHCLVLLQYPRWLFVLLWHLSYSSLSLLNEEASQSMAAGPLPSPRTASSEALLPVRDSTTQFQPLSLTIFSRSTQVSQSPSIKTWNNFDTVNSFNSHGVSGKNFHIDLPFQILLLSLYSLLYLPPYEPPDNCAYLLNDLSAFHFLLL